MSCSTHDRPIDVTDILARLKTLSSAEDFFGALGVAYDPKVLQVARLHILKRMGEYLATEDFDGLPDLVIAARAKATLARAYGDFESSSPLSQRVFRVLKDHDPDRPVPPKTAFVALGDIMKPIASD
ncbi:Nitrogenase-stabilizing/protective protein NifW [Hartmannibacter diazotrophicus]|uniref:Nitrogenase-stabilizing/protective protein NifW n=1 Tax=Hartmannibacter diazotrophicus TaxID=1482074 RepID=A0A2C9D0E5_9HYPH|nr:nitrogenase stabilizing/protective protein NifW [Hartmannibacter diazotrophicus]SON53857.1 Nitrogenase-stabilizing/protective protein NifW [Hartmannibacter diazotrophicus]